MAATETIRYEVDEGVATLTLNRPERLNAFVPEMQDRYFVALDRAAADPQVRVVVVTGAGRGFCSGQDLSVLETLAEGRRDFDAVVSHRHWALPASMDKPVIAAINGAAAGLGFVIACSCDLRFAAQGAKFVAAFSRRGIPAEYGVSWLLPRITGTSAALDLLLSGRPVATDEAAAMGLVDRVVPADELLAVTTAYARELAAHCSPAAMAAIKGQVYRDVATDFTSASTRADDLVRRAVASADFREGVESFRERRPARFAPRIVDPTHPT